MNNQLPHRISNAYYFKGIQKIGGIETFLYQLAKKFGDRLVIYYEYGNLNQLKRLSKYCSVIKYKKGTPIVCDKFFCNFNIDPIENGDVIANEKCLVIHGNYKWLSSKPPQHKDIDKYYAVSKDSAKAFEDLTGIKCAIVYNPLELDKPKKTLMLMAATRIDKVKGGRRMVKLLDALDKYCNTHDTDYLFVLFTSHRTIEHPNLVYANPKIDLVGIQKRFDYGVQLSENVEGYNYTTNEFLSLGIPMVITPCDVYKELGINQDMAIFLDFDCSNIDQVVEDMFTRKFNFTYKSPHSRWDELLSKESNERKDFKVLKVKATSASKIYGVAIGELDRIANEGEEFEIAEDRAEVLLGGNRWKAKFIDILPVESEIKPTTKRKKKNEE